MPDNPTPDAAETRPIPKPTPPEPLISSQPVRAVRLTVDGVLELVDVHPDPIAFAEAVGGVGPNDLWARATWHAPGAGILTLWTARSAPRTARNELAARVVEDLMPRLPGAFDRVWERVTDEPCTGTVLVTGYEPGETWQVPGFTIPVSDVAIDRIRACLDGRKATREAAAAAQAETTTLPAAPPTTAIGAEETEQIGTVADLGARMRHPAPKAAKARKTGTR